MSVTVTAAAAVENVRQTSAVEGVPAAPAKDAAATAPEAPAAPKDPNADVFARRERQLREQQRKLQAERQAWESQRAKYETDYVPKSRLTEDPFSVLSDAGMSYEKLTELMLSQPNMNDPAVKTLMTKLKAIEEKQTAQERAVQEAQERQYESAIKALKSEATMLVDADAEFETIKSAGMVDAVVELMQQTYEAEGRLMDLKEAARQVETYLVEEALKAAQWSKVQARLKPQTPPPGQEPAPATKQSHTSQPQLKTLTNSMPTQPTKRSADAERRARAIAAFKGQAG